MKKYVRSVSVLFLLMGSFFFVNQSFASNENQETSVTEEQSSPLIDKKESLEHRQDSELTNKNLNQKSSSWLAEELDGNRPFIEATIEATGKTEDQITLEDLAEVQVLEVSGASSIPKKISDYTQLAELYVFHGTVSEIPDSLYTLKETLYFLNLNDNHFVTLPKILFDDHFWVRGLTIALSDNQIVSDIPKNIGAKEMLKYNSRNNMLEHYNVGGTYYNLQSQLRFKGEAPVITVPIGYDFNKAVPDTTNLTTYSVYKGYQDLFSGHQFIYYDAGTSPEILTNGVATNVGQGKIKIKSAFSTNTNPFAQTDVTVVVEKGGKVTSHFVDEKGNQLAKDKVYTGLIGESYQTEALTIENYEFSEIKGNSKGVYTATDQEVTYVYKALDGEAVSVHYEDADHNVLMDPVALKGKIGAAYETKPADITGYELVETLGNQTGTFTNFPQEVIYIYEKLPEKIAHVRVRYATESGELLTKELLLTGNVGAPYLTEEKEFLGYQLKEVKGKSTGNFIEMDQIVTYVYKKNGELAIVIPSESDPNKQITSIIPIDKVAKTDQVEALEDIPKLPHTGEAKAGRYTVLGILVIVVSIGYFYKRKSK